MGVSARIWSWGYIFFDTNIGAIDGEALFKWAYPPNARYYPIQPDARRSHRDFLRKSSESVREQTDNRRSRRETERYAICVSNLYARRSHRKESRINRIIA